MYYKLLAENPQPKDQVPYRATHRVKITAGVNCRWLDQSGRHFVLGLTHDISVGGFFFKVSNVQPVEPVASRLDSAAEPASEFPRVGKVVRCLIALPDVAVSDVQEEGTIEDRWIEAETVGKVNRVEQGTPIGIAVSSRVIRLTRRTEFVRFE